MKIEDMTDEEYADTVRNRWCWCGSHLRKYPLYDGYNIFLTYACEKCEKEKLSEFVPDIKGPYTHDEPLDEE